MPRLVTVSFDARALVKLSRDIKAQFGAPLRTALTLAHEDMASTVQRGIAEQLARQVSQGGRPQTFRTGADSHQAGTLGLAIMHDDNRRSTAGGFRVGLEEHYDRSAAKRYWRAIESGRAGFWGYGAFFDPGGPTGPSPTLAGSQGRFPQARNPRNAIRGVWVKPFAGYQYHEGGVSTFRAMDKWGKYQLWLGRFGITISQRATNGRFTLSAGS
jgi:hypothetical protein